MSYTADELRDMIARGEDRSDWARVKAMTDEELEAIIAADPGDDDFPLPPLAALPLDPDVRAALPEEHAAATRTVNAILRAHFARADAA